MLLKMLCYDFISYTSVLSVIENTDRSIMSLQTSQSEALTNNGTLYFQMS